MKRVLQIVYSLKKNGTETFIMNVLRTIDRKSIMFDFLIFNDSKEGYYEEVLSYGSNVFYIPPRNKNPYKFYQRLNKFFSTHKGKYDIVHMNDMSMSTIAPLYFAKKYKIPNRIIHIHSSNCQGLHNKFLHKINKQWISKVATQFIGCSNSAINWGFANTSIFNKAKVIYNGIDLDKFKFNKNSRETIRKNLNLNNTDKILIHVGSFLPVKNHRFLLEIFFYAKKEIPNIKLLLLGDGPTFEEMRDYAKTLKIENEVKFLGRKDNISDFMSAADCVILPSLHEGFPIALIESQAIGLPIITSTGISEEVKISDNFKRIDLKDNKEIWIKTLQNFLNHNKINRTENKEIEKFSVKNTVTNLYSIYQKEDGKDL